MDAFRGGIRSEFSSELLFVCFVDGLLMNFWVHSVAESKVLGLIARKTHILGALLLILLL